MSTVPGPLPERNPRVFRRRVRLSEAKSWGRRLLLLILSVCAVGLAVDFMPVLTALVVLGFCAAAFGLRRPVVGLLGIGILCTLDATMRHFVLTGGLLRWNTFNYWLLIVILTAIPFLLRLKDLISRLFQGFVLLLGCELVYSPDWKAGLQDVLALVSLFGIIVYFARASWDKHVWYWLGMVGGSLSAGAGLIFYLQGDRIPSINPNAWAHFPLTAIFSICLAAAVGALERRRQLTLGLLAVVNFSWVFLTGSRGGLLIAVFCMLFLIFQVGRLAHRLAFLSVGLALGLALAALFAEQKAYSVGRVQKLLDTTEPMGSRTSGRSDLVTAGWKLFLDHPFGIGTGGFTSVGADVVYGSFSARRAAHSAWIKTLAENGVPGALLLGCYVMSFAIVGWRMPGRRVFPLGLLTTVTLGVAFLSTEFQSKGLWFLAAGTTVIFNRESRLRRSAASSAPTYSVAAGPARPRVRGQG